MNVYIVSLSVFLFSSFIEILGIKKISRNILFVGLISVLIFFVGFRYKTGADWTPYIRFFNQSLSSSVTSNWEPGYQILNKTIKYIFDDYYVLQFIVTFFVCISTYNFIRKYSSFPIVSLSLFVIFFFNTILMAQVRQSIALAIVMLGTPYIFKRRMISFFFMVALACMFHISAICAFPLYFLYCKINKSLLILMILLAPVFYFKKDALLSIVSIIAPFLPGRLSIIAMAYLKSTYFLEREAFNSGMAVIHFLMRNIMVLFLIIYKNTDDKKTCFFLNTMAIAFALNSVATGFEIIARIAYYYQVYSIITYTYLVSLVNFKYVKDLFFVYICCLLIFFAISFIRVRLSTQISPITGRSVNYNYIPYYNVLYHPYEAQFRKDWTEK